MLSQFAFANLQCTTEYSKNEYYFTNNKEYHIPFAANQVWFEHYTKQQIIQYNVTTSDNYNMKSNNQKQKNTNNFDFGKLHTSTKL